MSADRAFFFLLRLTGVLAVLSSAAGSVQAADPAPDAKLRQVEKQLEESREREKALGEKAAELEREIAALREDLVGAARTAQDTEEELSGLESRLADLKAREKALKSELSGREEQLVGVLTALERLALRPPEALLVQPGPADDTVRSAILLRSAVPELRTRADALRQELASLDAVRKEIAEQRTRIAVTGAKLDSQHAKLARLFERKQALAKSTQAERAAAAQKAQALAKDADSLRDLLAKLEVERKRREEEARRLAALVRPKPELPAMPPQPARKPESRSAPAAATAPAAPPAARSAPAPTPAPRQVAAAGTVPMRAFEDQRGAMPMPARGRLVTRYGQGNDAGGSSKGIVVRTRPGAQVVAPADGTVAFAGPFRGYGQLLIMEHGGGYHTLLSGMARIDATVGQRLSSGEPVGVMDQVTAPNAQDLYVELRRDGAPINPLPWLTARKG